MEKALIIYNPSSGVKEGEDYAHILKKKLTGLGLEVELHGSQSGEDIRKTTALACKESIDVLFILGGDGSIKQALEGMLHQENRPKLGIIPTGTGNLLAASLGIDGEVNEIIENLDLSQGSYIDIGRASEEAFGYMYSIGKVSQLIQETDKKDKKNLGILAYVKDILTSGLDFPLYDLAVTIDGRELRGTFSHLLVSNSTRFKEKNFAQGANEVDDGLFNVFLFKDMSGTQLLELALDTLKGALENNDKVDFYTGRKVEIRAFNSSPPTNIDGEEGPDLPIVLEVLPNFVEVIMDHKV